MHQFVGQLNSLGKITSDLRLPGSSDLSAVIQVANTTDTVISNLGQGNVLGAIAGFTGLFGRHEDENAAFQA